MSLRAHELREQRHGLAAGDQRQARDAVVGAMADVGIEAAELAAGPVGDLLPAGLALPGRPCVAGQLGQRHGVRVAPRRRVAVRQDEADRIGAEVFAVHPGRPRMRLVLPLVGQHEVDVAERERGQRLLGLGLDQLAPQRRGLAGERLHRRDGEPERDGLEGGDPAAPGDPAGGGRQLGLGELGPLEQRGRVTDEDERRVGEPDAASRRFEQRHAGLPLEHRELLGDSRRGELERFGHRCDRPSRVELVEEPEAAQIEH
jgi:hypothetical protein